MNAPFRSAEYKDARYRAGGTSGAGSYGRLADYKAAVINGVIALNGIAHVADFGCGDGNLLSLLRPPAYTGLDVSETVLARCGSFSRSTCSCRSHRRGRGGQQICACRSMSSTT